MEALWIWRQFPKQIASDLSQYHHRRIADWHRGTVDEHGELILSSYELLELLEYMPERGAFKTAMRGGEWPLDRKIAAEQFNELARFRASFHSAHGGKDAAYEPAEIIDPIEIKAREEAQQAHDQSRAQVEQQLFRRFQKPEEPLRR